jgi:uncharacterized protein (TIGR02996 family)
MDLLHEREAFLRAIFDSPDDDTPRLVYADFLDENDDSDRATYIRYDCELAKLDDTDTRRQIIQEEISLLLMKCRSSQSVDSGGTVEEEHINWPWMDNQTVRGFPLPAKLVTLPAKLLNDESQVRADVVHSTPEFFGARGLKVIPPPPLPPLGGIQLDAILKLPFVQQMSELDLSGVVSTSPEQSIDPKLLDDFDYKPRFAEMWVFPTITIAAVNVLARHRNARRLTALDLRHNNLDNDAARALVKSPYLDNLKRLDLLDGNRFQGRVWQLLVQRFGENVVG